MRTKECVLKYDMSTFIHSVFIWSICIWIFNTLIIEWVKLPARKRTLLSKNTAFTFLYPSFMFLQLVEWFKWIVCNSDCQNKVRQTEEILRQTSELGETETLVRLKYRETDTERRCCGNKWALRNNSLVLRRNPFSFSTWRIRESLGELFRCRSLCCVEIIW